MLPIVRLAVQLQRDRKAVVEFDDAAAVWRVYKLSENEQWAAISAPPPPASPAAPTAAAKARDKRLTLSLPVSDVLSFTRCPAPSASAGSASELAVQASTSSAPSTGDAMTAAASHDASAPIRVMMRYVTTDTGYFGDDFDVVTVQFDVVAVISANSNHDSVASAGAPERRGGPPDSLHATMNDIAARMRARLYPLGILTYVAYVSPISGKGESSKLWDLYGARLLRETEHQLVTIATTHRLHAEEDARDGPYGSRHVLVAVGGDGMIHEVVNGLQQRASSHLSRGGGGGNGGGGGGNGGAVAEEKEGQPMVATFPTGSGCGLAKTLGLIAFLDAAKAIVHPHPTSLDLIRVETTAAQPPCTPSDVCQQHVVTSGETVADRYAFLCVNFAIINEIDKGSESLRFLGSARFTVYAAKLFVSGFPLYKLTVEYVAASQQISEGAIVELGSTKTVTETVPHCTAAHGCPYCHRGWATAANRQEPRRASADGAVDSSTTDDSPAALDVPPNSRATLLSPPNEVAATGDASAGSNAVDRSPPLQDVAAGPTVNWKELRTDPPNEFVMVAACNVPYLARDMNFAPHAHLSDGHIDLVYSIGAVDRTDLLGVMIDMEEGKQFSEQDAARKKNPAKHRDRLGYLKCSKVRIAPHEGVVMVDGEVVPFGTVTLTPVRAAVTVLSRAPP